MQPLIINLAPTGMVPLSAKTQNVPITPQKIADDVACCAALGASIVHLHARKPDGTPTEDPGIYADIISRVRAKVPDIVIVASTSGRFASEVEKRATSLYLDDDVKPDMASLTLGSLNFSSDVSVNAPKTILELARIMQERNIKPELEVFDPGMVNFAKILIKKGLITPPYYFNIFLGNPGTAQASLLHLATMVADLPPESFWSVAGIGRYQTVANGLGVVMGHGVRTGLEDNLWFDDERLQSASNAQLVSRIVAQATALGRPIANAQEVRAMLKLGRGGN